MDATHFRGAVLAVLFVSLTGCSGGLFGIAARPPAPPPEPQPIEMTDVASTNVDQAADAPTEEYSQAAQWAQSVPRESAPLPRSAMPQPFDPAQYQAPDQPPVAEQDAWNDPYESEFAFPAESPIATEPVAARHANSLPDGGTAVATIPSGSAPRRQDATKAPQLKDVRLQVQAPASTLRTTERRADPTVNSPETVADVPASLAQFVDRLASESADAAFHDQLQRRVLQALAGNDDEARRALEMFSREQQEVVTGFIELLISLRDAPQSSSHAALVGAQDAVTALNQAVQRAAGLQVPAFALCTRVDGFGRYEALHPPVFAAGSAPEFVAYCELRDFQSRLAENGEYVSEFGLKLHVLSRSGETVHEFEAADIVDRCRSRRRDCFIAPLVRIDTVLSPGEYVVKITIVDKIGQKVAENRTTFRVSARS